MELPGITPEAVAVLAEERVLTIRESRPESGAPKNSRSVPAERHRPSVLTRQFGLPAAADDMAADDMAAVSSIAEPAPMGS